MIRELAERLVLVAASVLLGVILGCTLAAPSAEAPARVDQRTDATQITAQAAPGSVVQVGPGSAPTAEPRPP